MNIQEIRSQYPQYSDLTDIQLASALHKKFYADIPFPQFADKIGLTASEQAKDAQKYSPVSDSWLENLAAGAGKAVTDLGRGAAQIAGMGPSPEAVDEMKRLDAPLMDTKAGYIGSIGGNVAASAPAMMIPGANSPIGSTLIGATMGALQPVGTHDSRALNTAIGGVFGLGGHYAGKAVPKVIDWAKGKVASVASQKTANAARDATLAEARQAGYVVPPSEVKPGVVSNLLEKWAGKASVGQQASINNQQVTNKLVRESLKLPKDTPITPDTLQPVKQAAWSVYDQVKNLGQIHADEAYKNALSEVGAKFNGLAKEFPDLANSNIDDLVKGLAKDSMSSEGAVEAIKNLRYQAKTNLNPMNMNPAARSLGKAQSAAADAIESLIERNIHTNSEVTGNAALTNLLKDFRNARVTLAKVGTVERAMNESTGDVSAKALARELAKGKPLTGELRTAAKFSQAFPRYTQQNVNAVPGGSPLDMMAAIGTSAATQNPAWLTLALGRPAARAAVLSRAFAGAPSYSPGVAARVLPYPLALLNNKYAGLLAPSGYFATTK